MFLGVFTSTAHRLGAQCPVRGRTHQCRRVIFHLAQLRRPVARFKDHRHPVVQPLMSALALVVTMVNVRSTPPLGQR